MNPKLILALAAVAAALAVIRWRETQRYALPPDSDCSCCCQALGELDDAAMDEFDAEFDAEFGPTP